MHNQLVVLEDSLEFVAGREYYEQGCVGILYETSWFSKKIKNRVYYVGSHKVGLKEPYYGSGTVLQRKKYRDGVNSLRFRIVKSYYNLDSFKAARFLEENSLIELYWDKYGSRCLNLTKNGSKKGGVRWTPEMRAKFKQTSQKRFGTDHPFQAEEIKDKIKAVHQNNLGVEYPMQSDEVKAKSKATLLKKYGVENISQVDEIKELKLKTYQENHNGQKPSPHRETKEKYGVNNASQLEWVQAKKKKNIEKRRAEGGQTKQTKPVLLLDEDGNTLDQFGSASAAAHKLFPNNVKAAKSGICAACKFRGKYKDTYWRYV